ncbi:MAG: ABC transporter permease [Prevotellaceae bacterium]|jgi:putative ABC transport system permease protein|nr:ABC transporter permease [Prevotellaceae bacterium]
MFDTDLWYEIWVTITRNKMRSLLTGFGVFWGIFMLVVMMGSGTALQNGIMKHTEGFATNTAFFFTQLTGKPYKGFRKGRHWDMHNGDIEVVRKTAQNAMYVSPMLFGGRSEGNVVYRDKAGAYNVRGLYSDYAKVEQQRLPFGRFINEVDILQKRKVCVIGTRVYEEFFKKGENPIGQLIRVKGIYFQIIGVADGVSGVNIGGRSAESVFLPFTTFQQAYNQGDMVHFLAVTAKSGANMDELEKEVKAILRAQNKVAPDDDQAAGGFNLAKQFEMFDSLFTGIRLLVWFVGIGTLLAGVVGVSNIMLVTVRERTREIGVRRALGAKPSKIIVQIMTESLLLTALAGLLGLSAGVGLLSAVDTLLSANPNPDMFFMNPRIDFGAAITASVVLLFCGMLAGVIPTWRALKIKAIDAIREE